MRFKLSRRFLFRTHARAQNEGLNFVKINSASGILVLTNFFGETFGRIAPKNDAGTREDPLGRCLRGQPPGRVHTFVRELKSPESAGCILIGFVTRQLWSRSCCYEHTLPDEWVPHRCNGYFVCISDPQFTPGALAHTHVTHALYMGQNLRFLVRCGFSGCALRMPVQTRCVTSCVSA